MTARVLTRYIFVLFLTVFPAASARADGVRETPVVQVIRQCAPSVVNISTERAVLLRQHPFWGSYGSQFDNLFYEYNRSVLPVMKLQSLGSGVVMSAKGLIVTNAHVVDMASRIYVTLQNGDSYEASLIGTDNENDIALIEIPVDANRPLQPIALADDILIGETVVAIGNPFGLQNSVSSGIVSGTDRTFLATTTHAFTGLIQTDAPVNPGNSGGALISLDGKLLGISLAVVQNAQGIGFAVPAEKIKKMLAEYEKMKVRRRPITVPVH